MFVVVVTLILFLSFFSSLSVFDVTVNIKECVIPG